MDARETLRKAQLLFVDGKNKESIEAYTKAMEAGADPYIVYLSRGVAYIKMQDVDGALNDFSKAIGVNSQSARAYFFRGMTYMMKEEFENAVSDLSRALELKHDHFMAMFARGTSYARIGKFDEASKDIMTVMPQMEQNLQSFVDSYGIVRTEMWRVMAQLNGERATPTLELGEKEMDTLKKWLASEE